MLRTMLAALYLISIPGPSAWAQVSRAARVPVLPSASMALPAMAAPLGGVPSLSAASLHSAPSLSFIPALTAPAAAVPAAASAAPVFAALPLLPAAADAPKRAPSAAATVRAASVRVTEAVAHPASAAVDRERLDFADGSAPAAADSPEPVAGEASAPRPSGLAPAPNAPASPRLRGYLGGTFGAQLAGNALQVTMPLLFLKITGSAAGAALAVTIGSALDATGTLVGGWLTDRVRAKPVLIGTTIARGAAMAALPLLALTGGLTLPAVAAAYLVECFSRGIADTARNTLPSELSGRDDGLLRRILAKNQSFFEAGGVAGPFLAGALIAGLGGVTSAAALWLAPAAFAAVTLAYLAIPRTAATAAAPSAPAAPEAPKKTLDGWMRWALVSTALLTMYPLKGLLPAIFATQVLHDPASAAWLVGLFGVGGFAGSLAYGRWNKDVGARAWLTAGGVGAVALAAAFLPGAFWPAAAGVLAFAATNVAARLALNAAIQTRASPGAAGAAMGAARFTANLTGLGVRFLAGLAFTAAVAPALSFWIVGGGVALAAAGQIFVGGRLTPVTAAGPRLSPVHGMPGRLIVVEGLDGSGKSTQMERLKEELEAQGLKVVATSWNSSDVVSEAVKKAKKSESLTPQTFALMNASDLADRLDKQILPALREGSVVLADRWFYTALARDRVRGMDARWLRRLYQFAPKPDLVLYFRLPVKTAIGRVLGRSEGKLGLSEDYGDDEAGGKIAADRRGLKYYEAGLDVNLSKDPVENFTLFQTRVTAEYDKQAREFGFKIVDADRGRDEIRADVTAAALGALGPLASFKKREAPAAKANLFDKDPAGDAENIRANYLHEKRGAHFYFRNMLLPMQTRFAQLMDMGAMPKVFLHGSPHVDNYAKSAQGAAMVDFDRARVGPYAWDLVRLMVSLSLRRKKDGDGLLEPDVLKQLKKGYLRGFRHPDRPFSEMRELKNVEPEDDEVSTDAYLAADKKWAKEMRANTLPVNDPDVLKLIAGYAKTQEPGFLDEYFIEEAGRGQGSMGFRGLFLVVLAPRDKKSGRDRILLNIKATRTDPDTEWYKNPYPSEVERMHAAAELYAPGWTLRPGSATLDGVEYDVRPISPQNVKLKKMLNREQLLDLAYSAGTQLGRAHRLSLTGATPAQLEKHLEDHFDEIAAAGLTIRDEIVDAHARYLKNMKREGLEPHGDGGDE
ncbi:MAG: dTMP kinase [Elusimicrobia bacterium]|nr:dTMP kinase [Elusimicrobiota bacterium]